jgi:hypothetical protein
MRTARFRYMAIANINDRSSIERIYPADAFAGDASQNDRPKIETLRGVRIMSAPDEAGDFELEPASQQAGEEPQAVFLAPFHRATAEENAAVDPDPRHGYEAFLAEIVDTAQRQGYRAEAAPGVGDARLKGARQ